MPTANWYDVAHVTIDKLPDVVLLKIFDFYLHEPRLEVEALWYALVHVCQNWRYVVFGSPRRLDLRLFSNNRTPVKDTLAVWPLLPISVWGENDAKWGVDNIIAALEHNDRICQLVLFEISSSQMEKVLAGMQQPFLALKHLRLAAKDDTVAVPASFLGGSAPRLQTLVLRWIPFPGLTKLLLSATHLVHLDLWGIPPSGFFSPESIVTALSVLTSLEKLTIGFKSRRSRPNRHPPPQTRTLLPVLNKLRFKGVDGYLEDLVARIDAPLLDNLTITFFNQLIFDTAQLTQFISRTPNFKGHDKVHVDIADWRVSVILLQTRDRSLCLGILCTESDLQLSSLARVCSSFIPQVLIHAVEHLYIRSSLSLLHWKQDIVQTSQWLDLFRPFSAVRCLYISWEFAPRIAPVLQELVGERVTEVLPALQTLFTDHTNRSGPVQEAIERFVAARQHTSRPIAVSSRMGEVYWTLHKRTYVE